MFVNGIAFEFDLVWQMQPSEDLQNAWMMFDHIKRVQGWTTMVCHVYDPIYCKVMIIMICDMWSKDVKTQCIMWSKLNTLVRKKRLGMPIFKGFMVDGAQANLNGIHIVYGMGNPTMKMVDKGWTFFFHWT